jgi:hypothetical protein
MAKKHHLRPNYQMILIKLCHKTFKYLIKNYEKNFLDKHCMDNIDYRLFILYEMDESASCMMNL